VSTYTLTIDVHDLEPTGPVPTNAELRIWRTLPDASGPQVVSTRQHAINVVLTAGVAYTAEFTGVRGWEAPFTFSGTVDTSIAERWRAGQVDPTSLAPVTTYPTVQQSLAAMQTQINALSAGAVDNHDGTLTIN
jgi:hypothetical protein